MPLTGIPLPFLSYGGSALLAMLAGVGILLSVSRYGVDGEVGRAAKPQPVDGSDKIVRPRAAAARTRSGAGQAQQRRTRARRTRKGAR